MRSLLFLLFIVTACSHFSSKNAISDIQSAIIWTSGPTPEKQAYVVFRKTFELLDVKPNTTMKIFADSRYMLWINGQYVLRGPCRFNPKWPEYDSLSIQPYLKKGKNAIVILVHNYGDAINGRIMKHVPGLSVVMQDDKKEILCSDSTWRWNANNRYCNSPESWNTVPSKIDGRIDAGDWVQADFDDTSWHGAKAVDGSLWGKMHPRGLPLPKETGLKNISLLPSGEPLNKHLPIELKEGEEILVDLGMMAMTYTCMELDAEDGSELDIKYALRYKNGKPYEMYGVGDKYIATSGKQNFMTFDQWGCHNVLIRCTSGKVRINELTMVDRRYPFERIGSFESNDKTLNKLWDMAVNTIEVTCDDAYGSDARERNEWLQDPAQPNFTTTRVALAGPGKDDKLIYSDPRLLKNILRHAVLGQLPDGRILATFPTDRGPEDCHYFIDDYACQWIEALKIYVDATNDRIFLKEMWPSLKAQMKWFTDHHSSRGLLDGREYASFDNPLAYIHCEGATLNAYYYNALRIATYLAGLLDDRQSEKLYQETADQLEMAYNQYFWDDKEQAYLSAYIDDKKYAPTSHAQLIALYAEIVPKERIDQVRKWFLTNYKNPGMFHCCHNPDYEKMIENKAGVNMPVVYYWVFTELYRMDTKEKDMEAVNEIRRRWTPMVSYQQDAGTLSESFINEKGEGATESCHNYGAVPAYFLSSYVLGVQLDGPVWNKKLIIKPRLADLTYAKGIVVSEFGPVSVNWQLSENDSLSFDIEIPDGISATINLPKPGNKFSLFLNGQKVLNENIQLSGRWVILENQKGHCKGVIKTHI